MLAVCLPAALVVAALASAPPWTPPWTPVLLAQAPQKALYVSVVDQSGAPVPDIKPADLVVREDNLSREILRVEPATDPMQIAILVDNSQAARNIIADLRRALPPLVDELLSGTSGPPSRAGNDAANSVAIVALGSRPTILTDYTRDRALLKKGMDLVWAQTGSGNYLLDGILEVSQGFKKRGAARPVIIAVTTEGPELSSRHYDQVLTALRESGAAFYALVVGPLSRDTISDAHDRDIVLDEGTRNSGGHRETVLASSALTVRLKQVGDEITHQYRVTYARPQSLIPPEHVVVSTPRPGLTARGTPVRDQQARP